MKTRIVLSTIVLMFILAVPASAGGKEKIQKYFSNTAEKVKSTEIVSEKREILNESFNKMFNALNKIQNSGLISKEESGSIDLFKTSLKEKQAELEGINGFERVPDSQLNEFSNYVVQDMEQASITISLLALVVIIILLVYLL